MKELIVTFAGATANVLWWTFFITNISTNNAWEAELRQEVVAQNIAHWNWDASCVIKNKDVEHSDLMDYIELNDYQCE